MTEWRCPNCPNTFPRGMECPNCYQKRKEVKMQSVDHAMVRLAKLEAERVEIKQHMEVIIYNISIGGVFNPKLARMTARKVLRILREDE